jgi:hypothetical protein
VNGYIIKSRWTVWYAQEIVPEAARVWHVNNVMVADHNMFTLYQNTQTSDKRNCTAFVTILSCSLEQLSEIQMSRMSLI